MKFKVLLFLFSLIYCTDYIAANYDNNNNNNEVDNLDGELLPQHHYRRHHHHYQSVRNVRQANDNRCDAAQLEKLSISALATAANFSDHCSNVATGIFSRRFASDTVSFSNAEAESFVILKHFGRLITKLSLRFYYTKAMCTSHEAERYAKLLREVNQQCRSSLIEFQIISSSLCSIDIFNEIKGQFGSYDRVEKLSIQIKSNTIKTDHLQLNTIFPNVRRLEWNVESITDWKFIDCEYRNLDELSLADGLLNKSLDGTFISLLKQNKRIRWLSITSPTYHALDLVHKYLLNLEEFHIRHSIEDDPSKQEIEFSHIKKLNIQMVSGKCNPPNRIKFNPGLEELVLYCAYSDIGDGYFTFLSQYQQVKNLTAGTEFNNTGLMRLVGKYPNLSVAEFGFRTDVMADDIVKFVNFSKRLNVLKFMYISMAKPNEFKKQLESQIGKDFNIVYDSSVSSNAKFVIQRKVSIGSGTNVLASTAFILFAIVLHINRLLFFYL